MTVKMATKNCFFVYYFLKLHFHHFSKMESYKESQNKRNEGFSYYFCFMIEGSGAESGRPKNIRIRLRLRIRLRPRIPSTDRNICTRREYKYSCLIVMIHELWVENALAKCMLKRKKPTKTTSSLRRVVT